MRGGFVEPETAKDFDENVEGGHVASLDVARCLDGLECVELAARRGQRHGSERRRRRARVELRALSAERGRAIAGRESLPGQLLDALVIRPCVLREAGIHRTGTVAREEPRRDQLQVNASKPNEPSERWRCAIA